MGRPDGAERRKMASFHAFPGLHRAEYVPTPRNTEAQRAGNQCHAESSPAGWQRCGEAPRVGNACHGKREAPSAYHGFSTRARDVKTFGHANHQEASAADEGEDR